MAICRERMANVPRTLLRIKPRLQSEFMDTVRTLCTGQMIVVSLSEINKAIHWTVHARIQITKSPHKKSVQIGGE